MGVRGQELLNESENVRQYSDIGLSWSKTWTFKGHKSQHNALFILQQPKFPISNNNYITDLRIIDVIDYSPLIFTVLELHESFSSL